MSLINEALKKAQRLRSDEPADLAAPMPGGGTSMAKRGQPRSSQQLLLLASGGLVLVVLSVVITFWLANRTPAEKSGPKAIPPKAAVSTNGPAPAIVPPVIKPAATAPDVASTKPPPPVRAPAEVAAATPSVIAPPPSAATTTPPAAPNPGIAPPAPSVADAPATRAIVPSAGTPDSANAPAIPQPEAAVAVEPPPPSAPATSSAAPKPDERVHVFVDAVKVAGIRSSGGDSRVLMNDRVYRVNDIVERSLGIRLTKVEPDALTFTDGNGVIYVKHF